MTNEFFSHSHHVMFIYFFLASYLLCYRLFIEILEYLFCSVTSWNATNEVDVVLYREVGSFYCKDIVLNL